MICRMVAEIWAYGIVDQLVALIKLQQPLVSDARELSSDAILESLASLSIAWSFRDKGLLPVLWPDSNHNLLLFLKSVYIFPLEGVVRRRNMMVISYA